MKTLTSLSSDLERKKIWDYISTLMVEEKRKQVDSQNMKAGERETEELYQEKVGDTESGSDPDYFQGDDYIPDDGVLEEVDDDFLLKMCCIELMSYQQYILKR